MLTPAEIAGRQFLVALRGYDRDEVSAFLAEVADHVRILQGEITELETARDAALRTADEATAALEEARSQAAAASGRGGPTEAQPAIDDPFAAFRSLGEETTRILVTAEESARSITQRAEERAAAELDQARREVRDELQSARRSASQIIAEAEQQRGKILDQTNELQEVRDRLATDLRAAVEAVRGAVDVLADTPAGDTHASDTEPGTTRTSQPPPASAATRPEPEPEARSEPEAEPEPRPQPELQPEPEPETHPEPQAEPGLQAEPEPDSDAPEPEDATGAAALAARREAVEEVMPDATRRVKRVLADVQNVVLESLREAKGTPELATVLPGDADLVGLAEVSTDALAQAYGLGLVAGAALVDQQVPEGATDESRVLASAASFRAVLSHDVTAALRATLSAGIDGKEPEASLSERVGEVFRDLKGPVAESLVEQHVARVFGYGQLDAWRALGLAGKRWVPGTAPRCPEEMRQQNADAGALGLDVTFPTGEDVPPAHDGCNCALAPS